jgi:hypothetical protein
MFGLRIYKATFYPVGVMFDAGIARMLHQKEDVVEALFSGPPPATPKPRPTWTLAQSRGPNMSRVLRTWPADEPGECYSCGEPGAGECPKSKRSCGHHCNCSWVHDHCHWCGQDFGEESERNWRLNLPSEDRCPDCGAPVSASASSHRVNCPRAPGLPA